METACRTFLWSIPALCLSICQAAMAETAPFAPGQIWTYHGATPASSRVIIGAVDTFAGESQPVVSISITDAPIPTRERQLQTVPHLPIAADTLRASVIELEGTGSVPGGFENGYRLWRQAYDSKKGGYFTISVEKIVGILRNQVGLQLVQQPEVK